MYSYVGMMLVYRATPSLPRVILLSHALNYKRVWRGGREGLAEVFSEVISIHEALTNQIAVQKLCHGSHLVSGPQTLSPFLFSYLTFVGGKGSERLTA